MIFERGGRRWTTRPRAASTRNYYREPWISALTWRSSDLPRCARPNADALDAQTHAIEAECVRSIHRAAALPGHTPDHGKTGQRRAKGPRHAICYRWHGSRTEPNLTRATEIERVGGRAMFPRHRVDDEAKHRISRALLRHVQRQRLRRKNRPRWPRRFGFAIHEIGEPARLHSALPAAADGARERFQASRLRAR